MLCLCRSCVSLRTPVQREGGTNGHRRRGTRWEEAQQAPACSMAGGSPLHGGSQTPPWQTRHASAGRRGTGQWAKRARGQKMPCLTARKKAAGRFYSSCQHPIANQQLTLTTKLSKKQQRLGHLSDGLSRSQLSAQETAKHTKKKGEHITYHLPTEA